MPGGSFRRPLVGSFSSSLAIQGLTVVTGVLLARQLGPHGRGELAGILLWTGLLTTIGSLGLADSVAYHAAREPRLGALVGTSIALCLAQSVVLIAIGWLVLPLALHSFDSDTVRTAQIFLAYIPVFLMNIYAMSILQGLGRFSAYQVVRVLQIVVVAVAFVSLAVFHAMTLHRVVGAYFAAYVICLSLSVTMMLRVTKEGLRVDTGLARSLLGFAVRSHSSNVSALFNERLDQLLISVFLAPAQLGLYVVAVTLTSLTNLVGASVGIVVLPTVAAADESTRRVLARRYLRLTFVVAAAISIPMIVFAPTLVGLFFGSSFSGAATASRILLVAAVALTLARVSGVLLKGIGRPLDAGIAEFVALGVTLVFLVALLPLLGIVGAAIASLAAYAVSAGWSLRRLTRKSGLTIREVVGGTDAPWKEARAAGGAS